MVMIHLSDVNELHLSTDLFTSHEFRCLILSTTVCPDEDEEVDQSKRIMGAGHRDGTERCQQMGITTHISPFRLQRAFFFTFGPSREHCWCWNGLCVVCV